jgi:hypothetical protein
LAYFAASPSLWRILNRTEPFCSFAKGSRVAGERMPQRMAAFTS